MKKNIFFYIIFLFFGFNVIASELVRPLKIHLFSDANGKGLDKDRDVLIEELTALNCTVEWFEHKDYGKISFADINIFIQHINVKYINTASLNWFIPNPEWYTQHVNLLNSMDLILCKTHEVERIFKEMEYSTQFLGFTTPDRYKSKIKKIFPLCLHVAGSSEQKGTSTIKNTWLNHEEFPHLSIVKQIEKQLTTKNLNVINYWLTDEKLIELQNMCPVHICTSETEGFGHSIMEAMSVGAVVLTTNAPPMNEFIEDKRFLVNFSRFSYQGFAINYYVDQKELEKNIRLLQKFSKTELEAIGLSNRNRYLEKTNEFKFNLQQLLETARY